METKFDVKPEAIQALKIIAPTNNMRPDYNAIFIEIDKDGIILGATDGHRMLVHRAQEQTNLPPLKAVIPINLFTGVKKSGGAVTIELRPGEDTSICGVAIRQNGIVVTGKTMAYEPVRWRAPIKPVTGEKAQYNAWYMGDFARVYKLLHPKSRIPSVCVYHNGDKAAIIDLGRDDFFAVLMPMRIKEEKENPIPDWVMKAS